MVGTLTRSIAMSIALGLLGPSQPDGPPVAVAPMVFQGHIDQARRDELESAMLIGLTDAGFIPTRADPTHETCPSTACATELATRLDSEFVVLTTVEFADKNYTMRLRAMDAKGVVIAESVEDCELCGVAEATELLRDEATLIGKKLDAISHAMPVLSFVSTPIGAEVYVDGANLGRTPLDREIEPGEHRIELRAPNHQSLERTIVAVRGVNESFQFQLRPVGPDLDHLLQRKRTLRILGATGLGIGVLATATGATFLGIDGQPYKAKCDGDNVDSDGDCRQRFDTLILGASLTAAGVALLGVGTGLLVASFRRRPENTARHSFQIAPGLASVALSGKF